MNTLRLGLFTGNDHWRQVAERGLRAHAKVLNERPVAMTEALLAVDFLADTPREIAIVWPDGAAAAATPLLAVLRRNFLSARALAAGPESAIDALAQTIPFVRNKVAQGGQPSAYVCRHGRCKLPVADAAALEAQLRTAADS